MLYYYLTTRKTCFRQESLQEKKTSGTKKKRKNSYFSLKKPGYTGLQNTHISRDHADFFRE